MQRPAAKKPTGFAPVVVTQPNTAKRHDGRAPVLGKPLGARSALPSMVHSQGGFAGGMAIKPGLQHHHNVTAKSILPLPKIIAFTTVQAERRPGDPENATVLKAKIVVENAAYLNLGTADGQHMLLKWGNPAPHNAPTRSGFTAYRGRKLLVSDSFRADRPLKLMAIFGNASTDARNKPVIRYFTATSRSMARLSGLPGHQTSGFGIAGDRTKGIKGTKARKVMSGLKPRVYRFWADTGITNNAGQILVSSTEPYNLGFDVGLADEVEIVRNGKTIRHERNLNPKKKHSDFVKIGASSKRGNPRAEEYILKLRRHQGFSVAEVVKKLTVVYAGQQHAPHIDKLELSPVDFNKKPISETLHVVFGGAKSITISQMKNGWKPVPLEGQWKQLKSGCHVLYKKLSGIFLGTKYKVTIISADGLKKTKIIDSKAEMDVSLTGALRIYHLHELISAKIKLKNVHGYRIFFDLSGEDSRDGHVTVCSYHPVLFKKTAAGNGAWTRVVSDATTSIDAHKLYDCLRGNGIRGRSLSLYVNGKLGWEYTGNNGKKYGPFYSKENYKFLGIEAGSDPLILRSKADYVKVKISPDNLGSAGKFTVSVQGSYNGKAMVYAVSHFREGGPHVIRVDPRTGIFRTFNASDFGVAGYQYRSEDKVDDPYYKLIYSGNNFRKTFTTNKTIEGVMVWFTGTSSNFKKYPEIHKFKNASRRVRLQIPVRVVSHVDIPKNKGPRSQTISALCTLGRLDHISPSQDIDGYYDLPRPLNKGDGVSSVVNIQHDVGWAFFRKARASAKVRMSCDLFVTGVGEKKISRVISIFKTMTVGQLSSTVRLKGVKLDITKSM